MFYGGGGFVFQDSSDGGVVECAGAGGVWPSGHEERCGGGGGFCVEEEVGGLTGRDENGVGFERLDVDSVNVDDGESVVGDAEEELVVERSVDYAKEVCFSRLHLQLECICSKYVTINHHSLFQICVEIREVPLAEQLYKGPGSPLMV